MNLPALLFGWLIASMIGLVFHLIRGGTLRRILLYLITAWLGFAVGHVLGTLTGTTLIRLGAINLFTAVFGAILALILFELMSPHKDKGSHADGRPGASDGIGPL